MSEEDLKLLQEAFERLNRECNTKEKAIAQLKREGLLGEDGHWAPQYQVPAKD